MILKELKIEVWLGNMTNCYIVFDEKSKEIMVIDPAGDVEKIEYLIKNVFKGNLKYIFLTHCHGDHTGAVSELKNRCGGKVLIHRIDSENLNNPNVNLTHYMGIPDVNIDVDSRVDDGDLIHLGNLEFIVIHTPGHTAGGISLYCKDERCLFSGDTIFAGTWGRTDLPTSSREDIMNSIANKILVLPDDTFIYPGHGKATMLRDEKVIYLELKPKQW